jgi:hypothetical protein
LQQPQLPVPKVPQPQLLAPKVQPQHPPQLVQPLAKMQSLLPKTQRKKNSFNPCSFSLGWVILARNTA